MMKKKQHLLTAIAAIVLAMGLAALAFYYYYSHIEESPIHLAVYSYRNTTQPWEDPQGVIYAVNSGEGLFLEGMRAFDKGDYERARDLYKEALQLTTTDPALRAYLYYYWNLCDVYLDGAGDPYTVSAALKAIRGYEPLINDVQILWDLISNISLSNESDEEAIRLMQEHLDHADHHMELSTWAWLKNYIAMLEYNNQEYARSIRAFYDVELTLEAEEMTPEMGVEYRYAKEYIANIYFIFEDYERAAVMYQELIDMTADDGLFEAYACSINLATAYLETDEIEKAKQTIAQLEEYLPRIDTGLVMEIKASINDILANISLKEQDLEKADAYLRKAEEYYLDNREDEAYLGGKYFSMLTRFEYRIQAGETRGILEELEELIVSGEADYYGFEKEVYELQLQIYKKENEPEKVIEIYEKLMEVDADFFETTRREYLEFSEYYRENSRLKIRNERLARNNKVSIVIILVITLILAGVLVLMKRLRTRNITDQLTGVRNRKKLAQLIRVYKRSKTPARFGVIMLDIDFFKKYNDTYGHVAGDQVLREVAKVLQDSVRSKDVVIRYGGEEFLILLSDVTVQVADDVCRRIHEQLKNRALKHEASEVSDCVTLSIGLCHQSEEGGNSFGELIGYADECLYQSKEEGRNRTTVSCR